MSVNEQAMELAKLILTGESLTSEIRSKALALHEELSKMSKPTKEKVRNRTYTLVGGAKVTIREPDYNEYVAMTSGGNIIEAIKLFRSRHMNVSLNDAACLIRKIRDTAKPASK